ncbi:hypothetical protein DIPPA_28153 [Diplonema papillatum]|nr:hypothetical protein DIPPA_28153 [Diplonema papillatum]
MEVAWKFNFERWKPSDEEWSQLVDLLEPEEAARIAKFKRPGGVVGRLNPDAKSSLVGRLMLRSLTLSDEVLRPCCWRRTKEGKPFVAGLPVSRKGYNANVAHAGDYVTCVSSSHGLVGTDVMEIAVVPKRGALSSEAVEEFFDSLEDALTADEWAYVKGGEAAPPSSSPPAPEVARLTRFYVLWTLKESFIKAVGIGLGYEPSRITFDVSPWQAANSAELVATASGALDKNPLEGWVFVVRLDGTECPHGEEGAHVLATAVGPFSEATASFKEQLPFDGTAARATLDQVASRAYESVSIEALTAV